MCWAGGQAENTVPHGHLGKFLSMHSQIYTESFWYLDFKEAPGPVYRDVSGKKLDREGSSERLAGRAPE